VVGTKLQGEEVRKRIMDVQTMLRGGGNIHKEQDTGETNEGGKGNHKDTKKSSLPSSGPQTLKVYQF